MLYYLTRHLLFTLAQVDDDIQMIALIIENRKGMKFA